MSKEFPIDPEYVRRVAKACLDEDVGTGDLTAALTPDTTVGARLVCRQTAVICGVPFFEAVFAQLDPRVRIDWRVGDGDRIDAGAVVCEIDGRARPILTGERSAVNLLQTLSGTATATRAYVDSVAGTGVRILDTRKTLPGLRLAQKWAVRCAGGHNHRQGLFDGILIKENHLRSGESIGQAVARAGRAAPPNIAVTVEVENLVQLAEAVKAGAPRVLLDNFSLSELRRAVRLSERRTELEASGNIRIDNVRAIAETGVDCISVGAITKDLKAVDLSMQFDKGM